MPQKIIIGSRGSELALWQANFVMSELKKIGLDSEIKIYKTQGDNVHLSWDKLEGKGFFTKEIEDALLKKEIDLAVHSYKDLPTEPVKGLVIAAVSEREDPAELLLINKNAVDEKQKFSLKHNAVVGTSSARRKSQMLAWRNDLKMEDLRGNVPTRVQKVRDKKYDAILIANAGVSRLNLDIAELHCEKLDPREFIPAPAQGVLALQMRENDNKLFEKLQEINNKEVGEIVSIERKILNLFDGGCQLPLGVLCEKEENEEGEMIYKVRAAKADAWDKFPQYVYVESRKSEGLVEKVVEKIKNKKTASVFISRNGKKDDFFKRCLEAHGYRVFAQSLIEIKSVPIRKPIKADWIFFSSKNAVKYFFESTTLSLSPVSGEGSSFPKIAAVGKATAEEIRKFGKRAEFIGSSDDTRMTGKKFSALVGHKTVLFPQAKESMKTIQLQMSGAKVIDLVVYETLKRGELGMECSKFEVLVFTSPSNVETYFEKNRVSAEQKIVAMGDATANALRKFGVRADKMPASFDDLGLAQAVFSL